MNRLLYLDYNCFQRAFDDQSQVRIRMESAACEELFRKAAQGEIRIIWSFMHEDENAMCPFLNRKFEVLKLAELCKIQVPPDERIRENAVEIHKRYRLTPKDALHLACAVAAGAAQFITCDDAIIKRLGGRYGKMVIISPTEFVIEESR